MAALMSTMSFAQTLVTPPSDAEVMTFDILNGKYWYYSGEGANDGFEDYTSYFYGIGVVIVNNDIYLQGLSLYCPDGWIKGTISNGVATFPKAQYVGSVTGSDKKSYPFYLTGEKDVQTVVTDVDDIHFDYDSEAGTLTLTNPHIQETLDGTRLDSYLGVWENLVIGKSQPVVVPDPVTVPAGVDTKDWDVMGCPIQLTTDEKTGASVPQFGAEEHFDVKVARDGNDYYIQGLCYFNPDAWIKGTRSGNKVTFAAGQNFGIYQYKEDNGSYTPYQLFFLGFGQAGNCDMVFTINDEGTILDNTDALWMVTSMFRPDINYYADIYLVATITDKAYLEAGVKGVRENTQEPDAFYNLQGQKVENAKKGLYIKNGRKVLVR